MHERPNHAVDVMHVKDEPVVGWDVRGLSLGWVIIPSIRVK